MVHISLGTTESPQGTTEERHSQEAISSRTGITGKHSKGTLGGTDGQVQARTSASEAGEHWETARGGHFSDDVYGEGRPCQEKVGVHFFTLPPFSKFKIQTFNSRSSTPAAKENHKTPKQAPGSGKPDKPPKSSAKKGSKKKEKIYCLCRKPYDDTK